MAHGVPHIKPEQMAEENPYLGALGAKLKTGGVIIGVLGLGLGIVLGNAQDDNWRNFFFSYLVAFVFFVSLSLGGLFFTILQHLTRATWSVVVRRIAEVLAGGIPLLAVLVLPIVLPALMGNSELYLWMAPDAAALDESGLIAHKQAFLNPTFWALRIAFYFAIWSILGRFFLNTSLKQDTTGDVALTKLMWQRSAASMLLFALTITMFIVDMVMSLDPLWFSTIIGIYFFAGCTVGIYSVLALTVMWLQSTGRLKRTVTEEHRHDIGKMMFAFLFFWGYIAFSQYFLIWYANIPEETGWYQVRQSNGWLWVFLALLFGHFVLPFIGLLPRGYKRIKVVLGFWAVWLLAIHYIDLYWLVMPEFSSQTVPFGLIDLACLVGLGGLYVAIAAYTLGKHPLVPLKDPGLESSLKFENV